jgi:hypothetical protein
MIQTLTQLKREAANYTWEIFYNSYLSPENPQEISDRMKGERTIHKFQSNAIAWQMPNGELNWLHFKSAKEFSFELEGDTQIVIFRPAHHPDAAMKYRLHPINGQQAA